MRLLPVVIALLWLATPLSAVAKPKTKVAVAPLVGDPGGKITQAVIDALAGKDFVVTGAKDTKREMTKLGTGTDLNAKEVRKLINKLEVVAIIDGEVTKAGAKRSLHLQVHRRGQPDSGFTVEFKTTTSPGFRRGIHDEVAKKVEGATDDPAEEPKSLAATDDDAPAKRKPVAVADDDAPVKRKPVAVADDAPPVKRKPAPADDDRPAKPKQVAASDDDTTTVRKRRGKKLEDADQPTQQLAHLGVGPSVSQRRLAWTVGAGGTNPPPAVITSAPGVRIDGEVYPFAFGGQSGGAAGLGFAATYDKSFGLKITIPAGTAPIDQAHYSFGARYRFNIGAGSNLALGLDYFGRSYIADRTALGGGTLDTPDFNYSAVSPGLTGRTMVSPTVALYGGIDGLLMLDAGPVATNSNYGKSTVYGVEVRAGLDIALSSAIDLRFAAEYSQINLAFGTTGAMAMARSVMGATDRSIGGLATLGLTY